jgi:hypothetical protein
LRLVDPAQAAKKAEALRRRMNGQQAAGLGGLFKVIAAVGQERFARRIDQAFQRHGNLGYRSEVMKFLARNNHLPGRSAVSTGDIIDLYDGVVRDANRENEAAIVETGLEMMIPGLLETALSVLKRNLGEEEARTVAGLRVKIVDEGVLRRVGIRHGAYIAEDNLILLGWDRSLRPSQVLNLLVGKLDHELIHVVRDITRARAGADRLREPMLIEEALVMLATSQTLRLNGLTPIADMVDLMIFEQIARQDERKVAYVFFDDLKADDAAEMSGALLGSAGQGRMVVIAKTPAELKRAEKVFGLTGAQVVLLSDIARTRPVGRESAAEAWARQNLGTRRARIMAGAANRKLLQGDPNASDVARLIFVEGVGSVAELIIPLESTLRSTLTRFYEDRVKDLVINRQA